MTQNTVSPLAPLSKEDILKNAFAAAVAVADPQVIVPQYLGKIFPAGQEPKGRCLVVGAGKASASMASALEAYATVNWPQTKLAGVVLTRYGHCSPTSHIKIIEAGHPVPDQAGMDGAKEIFALTNRLEQGDVLIALVSGGGSSLLTLPQEGISIDDMRKTTEALLRSGAPIEEMNVVRKHLSAILGGNLASRGLVNFRCNRRLTSRCCEWSVRCRLFDLFRCTQYFAKI